MSQFEQRMAERGYVLQILYQSEILDIEPMKLVNEGLLADDTQLIGDYGKRILEGVTASKSVIDKQIVAASDNWSIDRMPTVDRCLLRLAVYEMQYVDEVPVSVAINEAVNIAKRFAGDDSPRFVNGILGKIALTMEQDKPSQDTTARADVDLFVDPDEAVAAVLDAIAAKDKD